MDPNHGTVVGDLRVLLSTVNTGRQHWYWWLISAAASLQGDADRHRYELRVVERSTGHAMATRQFEKRAQAVRARDRFVRLADREGLDSSSPDEVRAALHSSAAG